MLSNGASLGVMYLMVNLMHNNILDRHVYDSDYVPVFTSSRIRELIEKTSMSIVADFKKTNPLDGRQCKFSDACL